MRTKPVSESPITSSLVTDEGGGGGAVWEGAPVVAGVGTRDAGCRAAGLTAGFTGAGAGRARWSLFRNAHTFPAVAETLPEMSDHLLLIVDHSGRGISG